MTEQLSVECGPVDRQGRRLVVAAFGRRSHRDRIDPDREYDRRKFREAVVEKFGLADDAHERVEAQLLPAADAEDERADCKGAGRWQPTLLCMADVAARPVRWLWPERIALGRLSLLVGMPGAGKSFLTCDMAARVSTGSPWPDGGACPRGSALLVTAEDDRATRSARDSTRTMPTPSACTCWPVCTARKSTAAEPSWCTRWPTSARSKRRCNGSATAGWW
jgi:hypothetical protein